MKKQRLFSLFACGFLLLISSTSVYSQNSIWWLPCDTPPAEWEIFPPNPAPQETIVFQGPTGSYSNSCFGCMAAGGSPVVTVCPITHTVEIWFMPPPPDYCFFVIDPVCGLAGCFGPLARGNWTLFSKNLICDFSLEFYVGDRIKVLTPNGGQNWVSGNTEVISWQCDGNIPEFLIEYSINNGQDWIEIEEFSLVVINSVWSALWTVPDLNSQECLVRISDAADPFEYDVSDDVFTIFVCQQSFAADLNGDCYVNFIDFVDFARDWLACGNPFDPNCL